MKALYKSLRAALIGLTAIMTLVAGLPHFRCQCPNGSVKPFCFGYCCSSSGCCCGNLCSSAPGRRPTRAAGHAGRRMAACCVRAGIQPTHGRSDGVSHAQSRGCVRTVAQPDSFVLARHRPMERDHSSAGLLVVLAAGVLPGAVPTSAPVLGVHLAAPPPSDLVIVLQRFVI